MRQTMPRRANFDVGVLFYNRARQTLDCVQSFLNEDTQPDIVVLDQGSAAEQRQFLDQALRRHSNVRLVALAENVGAAVGRNRLCRECSAEWVLFADNDLALNSQGGVTLINSAVEHADGIDGFCPRLLNTHENRVVDRMRLAEHDGRLEIAPAGRDVATINTFAGGAVVLRRSLLLDDPYDERYFVGLEDFDLALRRFVGGRPLRLRALDDVTLIHKHMPVISAPDVSSTRTRYSAALIAKSFDILKSQHGGELFDHWQPWIATQQQEMIVARHIAPRTPGDKINVTFVVDVPNWAFDNVVRNLDRYLGDDHVLTIVYAQQDGDVGRSLWRIVNSSPDIIHFMWRADFRRLVCAAALKKCAALMGLSEAAVLDRLCQSHMTFSVCDHLFLDEADIRSFRPLYWLSDGYCVISQVLSEIYGQIADYPKPSAMILNGVDTARYHPVEPAKRRTSTIRIGWVGNSSWGEGQGLADAKGLRTIIRPAIETLRTEGIDVELFVVDRVERWRAREEVAALYSEMDIYVCASSIEGAPNTVLEAMASGIAVVSTRVGIVHEIFGPRQQRFIVERSVEAFVDALRRLCADGGLRKSLAQENLQLIAKHTWESRAPLWRSFFAAVVQQAHPDASNWKRLMIEKFFVATDPIRTPLGARYRDRAIVAKTVDFVRIAKAWISRG